MKDFKRVTDDDIEITARKAKNDIKYNFAIITVAWVLESKIENGTICERKAISKELAERIRDNLEQKGRFELSSYDGKEYLTISTDAFNKIFNQYIKNA